MPISCYAKRRNAILFSRNLLNNEISYFATLSFHDRWNGEMKKDVGEIKKKISFVESLITSNAFGTANKFNGALLN